ncbi:MAG: addiction module protein [Actinomycetia bacterium]|nr:addiction module protein [Actinomycetes bacterium]
MPPEVAEVERALLALPPADRAVVIERGLASLDQADNASQAEIDAAWLIEINRRVDEYAGGDTKLVDAADHFARVRASLSAPRP